MVKGDKMKVLNEMFNGVKDYCVDNDIEYVFAAVSKKENYIKISNSGLTNVILKKALTIIDTLLEVKSLGNKSHKSGRYPWGSGEV